MKIIWKKGQDWNLDLDLRRTTSGVCQPAYEQEITIVRKTPGYYLVSVVYTHWQGKKQKSVHIFRNDGYHSGQENTLKEAQFHILKFKYAKLTTIATNLHPQFTGECGRAFKDQTWETNMGLFWKEEGQPNQPVLIRSDFESKDLYTLLVQVMSYQPRIVRELYK